MNELLLLAPALAAGLLLGAFFFGGLWWTVIKGASSQRPALWFFGNYPGRILFCRARGLAAVAAVSLWLRPGASRRDVADPPAG